MNFDQSFYNLGVLDSLSYKTSLIHRLDPRTKLLAALAFVITVVSFPKYEITGLIPFFLFPILVFSLAEIPVWFILKKVLYVSVFALSIGLFNPLLDTRSMTNFFGVSISGGWISFFSILLKYLLTMTTVLLLMATTSFPNLAAALRKMGVSKIFISQLLFLYRYIFALMEETMRMVRARNLRSFRKKGRGIKTFIRMIGTLFIRTLERAERIYDAMLARGFNGALYSLHSSQLHRNDCVTLALVAPTLILLRTVDLVQLIGHQIEKMF